MQNYHSTENLSQYAILAGLTLAELSQLLPLITLKHFKPGEYVVHEGEIPNTVHLIAAGEIDIIKKAANVQQEHVITMLQVGQSIGEIALLDPQSRSASARAKTHVTTLTFSINDLKNASLALGKAYATILTNIGKETSQRLRYTNEVTIKSLQEALKQTDLRARMGNFLINIVLILCIYTYTLAFIKELVRAKDTELYASLLTLFIVIIPIFCLIKINKLPLQRYGLTLQGWQQSIKDAVIYTLPLLALIVLAKWCFIQALPHTNEISIFSGIFSHQHSATEIKILIGLLFIYILFAPVQEFIVRGVLQGSLQELFVGTHVTLRAILISNLIFSTIHLYLSIPFALSAFIPGLFWGWLYSRQKNLIGVSFSHSLVGVWTFYIVGI